MLNKKLFIKPNISLEGQPELELIAPRMDEPQETCPGCQATFDAEELSRTLRVCPHCRHHFRIGARERIALMVDEGTFIETDAELTSTDRIGFPAYADKLNESRKHSGEAEGVITGSCTIGGLPCALFSMNPLFMMGSMGTIVGDKITRLFERATKDALPVVGFTVSGGARVHEGILSLMQMAKTSGAVLRHSQAGLFYLTVLTDPTTGGVTASFAMEGDILLSEPGALVGFAGPRVIEQTMRQKLPEGFQRAEFLLKKGFIDSIVDRRELRRTIAQLLRIHHER